MKNLKDVKKPGKSKTKSAQDSTNLTQNSPVKKDTKVKAGKDAPAEGARSGV